MTKAEIEEEVKTLEAENEKLKQAKKARTDANKELADELKNLEAENEKLKSALADKKKNPSGGYDYYSSRAAARQEVADSVRDTTRTLADETSRILRGMTLSFFEPFRVYAEAIGVFSDQIASNTQSLNSNSARATSQRETTSKARNPQEEYDATINRSMNLSGDVFTGMAKSFNKIAEIPGRTIDRFYEGYREDTDYDPKR
jgi:DNA repair exonuclease SbcCD ATPase subunit